jgi:L-glyceraldehyde 3-phosphate reductase
MGCIVYSALAQELLTDRYRRGIAAESRAARENSTVGGSTTTSSPGCPH